MALIDQLNAISQEAVDGRVNESFFEQNVWLSLLTGRSMTTKERGRPGTKDLLGSLRPKSAAERKSLLGSNKAQVTVMSAKFGGGKGIGYRENPGNVTTLDTTAALEIPWTKHIQPIKVTHDDVDAAMGEFQIVEVMQRAVNQGMSELEELVGVSLVSGNPASQIAKQLSEYISIIATLDVDVTSTYANSDNRITTDTFLLPALYHDSAVKNFDWALIDDINVGLNGDNNNPNGGAATLGTGIDMVLTNANLFYKVIIPKARSDGHQLINATEMHELGLVGFKRPVVRYMNTLITFDPNFPALAKNGTAKSYLAGLTMDSWEFQTHPSHAFSISKWTDLQPTTRESAFQADISLKGRLICNNIARNGLFANVS